MGIAAATLYLLLTKMIFGEVCPMYICFGLPCPACGLTRAGLLLLQGKWGLALQMHAFIYVWIAYCLGFVYNHFVRKDSFIKWKKQEAYAIVILVGAMLLYYAVRMRRDFPNVEPMVWSKHKILFDLRKIIEAWKG